MRDIGLVGVPFSGKSTLFTALTRAGSHGGQANVAVVPVPDPRLGGPHGDGAFEEDRARAGSLRRRPGRYLECAGRRQTARVRRPGGRGPVLRRRSEAGRRSSPTSASELLLADLAVVESALEKGTEAREGQGPARRCDALQRAKDALDAERPLREAGLDERGARPPQGDRPADAEARGRDREPRRGRGAAGRARRRGRRVRLDRGRDDRDGPGGGASAARGVRRERAGPRAGDRGRLRGARPHHVPHDRRRRDARVGGAARRKAPEAAGRHPHRPRSGASSAPR